MKKVNFLNPKQRKVPKMADFNRVIILGRLTREPELKYTQNSNALCSFGMAVNRYYTDASGEKNEEACFVDCRAFGRQAENINEYVKKGDPLFIEGRLSFYSWETDAGERRTKLSVVVERMQLMPTSFGADRRDSDVSKSITKATPETLGNGQPQQEAQAQQPAPPPVENAPSEGEAEDDIPF